MKIIETCPECGHDLTNISIYTDPPIPKKHCINCGFGWEERKEEIVRVQFDPDRHKKVPVTLSITEVREHKSKFEVDED